MQGRFFDRRLLLETIHGQCSDRARLIIADIDVSGCVPVVGTAQFPVGIEDKEEHITANSFSSLSRADYGRRTTFF